MSQLCPMAKTIVDSIFAQWKNELPVALQIGRMGGKNTIVNNILSNSNVTSPLVVTPDVTQRRKELKDISFCTIINHRQFYNMYLESKDIAIPFMSLQNTWADTIIFEEPWDWILPDNVKSELLYKYAVEFTTRVLAIGTWNQTNVWSFDAVIPKYASWETNTELTKAILRDEQGIDFQGQHSDIHYKKQLRYGRNVLIDGEPHGL